MATAVLMPRQGQSVETCLILEWKKQPGDVVAEGDILCEVETDKATFEVESPATGTLLDIFYPAGEDVPVLVNITAIGDAGENVDDLRGEAAAPAAEAAAEAPPSEAASATPKETLSISAEAVVPAAAPAVAVGGVASPRAKKLAAAKGVDLSTCAGTGAKGRIIERDVKKVIADGPQLTPAAQAAVAAGGVAPASGTGLGGRVTTADIAAAAPAPAVSATDQVTEVPIKGIRKLIANRMHESLATTAQLTLNMSADASPALAFRKRLKASPEGLGLNKVTINDLVLFAVARTLPQHPDLNALFENDTVYQHSNVHLAFAVDTPRGLMVPVVRDANLLSLKQLSDAGKILAKGCIEGGVNPDDLHGGTITISNLGAYGVENFTPILNPPQVAILGVGKADLKPVQVDGEVKFVPHFALSLTINHMVVDGGPAAKFLKAVCECLANIDLYLAV